MPPDGLPSSADMVGNARIEITLGELAEHAQHVQALQRLGVQWRGLGCEPSQELEQPQAPGRDRQQTAAQDDEPLTGDPLGAVQQQTDGHWPHRHYAWYADG